MPELTRRRDPDRCKCWLIYFGDIHVGTISRCVGKPNAELKWQWLWRLYLGSSPDEQRGGTAPTFEEACALFGGAWMVFSVAGSEADYHAWHDQRDWT